MKLYTLRDVRLAARGRPGIQFLTQRDGPIKTVTLREAEEYFRGMSPKVAKLMGRWFEAIDDDPLSPN